MEVQVFTKDGCVQCDMTKKLLDKVEIPYTAIENSDQEPTRTELFDEGFRAFPVVKVEGGESWAGFRPDLIKKLVVQAMEGVEVKQMTKKKENVTLVAEPAAEDVFVIRIVPLQRDIYANAVPFG